MYGLGVNRLGVPSGKSNPAVHSFSISDLFGSSEEGGWYDPSDASTVFSDTAGTTAATLGGVVGKILDKSGNDLHLTANADNRRPLWGREPTSGARNFLENSNKLTTSDISDSGDGWVRSTFTGTNLTGTATSDDPPVGTGTVHKVACSSTAVIGIQQTQNYFVDENQVLSVYLKLTGEGSTDCKGLLVTAGENCQASVRLDTETITLSGSSTSNVVSSSLTDVGDGWYRFVMCINQSGGTQPILFYFIDSSNNYYTFYSSTPSILIYRPQLEKGTSVTTAQETGLVASVGSANTAILDATEEGYGHYHYLYFDGTDAIGNTNSFTSNEATVVISAEIEDDTQSAIVQQNVTLANGFSLWTNYDSTNKLLSVSKGIAAGITSTLSYPLKNIFTLTADSANDSVTANIGGGTPPDASNTSIQTAGYVSSGDLSVGSYSYTGVTTFKGKIYALVVRDTETEGSELIDTETAIKAKAGL